MGWLLRHPDLTCAAQRHPPDPAQLMASLHGWSLRASLLCQTLNPLHRTALTWRLLAAVAALAAPLVFLRLLTLLQTLLLSLLLSLLLRLLLHHLLCLLALLVRQHH